MNTTDTDRLIKSARQHGAANVHAIDMEDSDIIMGALMRTDLVHVPLTDGERTKIVAAWDTAALRERMIRNAVRRLRRITRHYCESWSELTTDEMLAEIASVEQEVRAPLGVGEIMRLVRAGSRAQ